MRRRACGTAQPSSLRDEINPTSKSTVFESLHLEGVGGACRRGGITGLPSLAEGQPRRRTSAGLSHQLPSTHEPSSAQSVILTFESPMSKRRQPAEMGCAASRRADAHARTGGTSGTGGTGGTGGTSATGGTGATGTFSARPASPARPACPSVPSVPFLSIFQLFNLSTGVSRRCASTGGNKLRGRCGLCARDWEDNCKRGGEWTQVRRDTESQGQPNADWPNAPPHCGSPGRLA